MKMNAGLLRMGPGEDGGTCSPRGQSQDGGEQPTRCSEGQIAGVLRGLAKAGWWPCWPRQVRPWSCPSDCPG